MKFILLNFFVCLTLFAVGQSYTDTCGYTYRLKYPEKALQNKISGVVIIEVIANDDGTLTDPVVIKGLGYGCDEEALRMVKRMIDTRNKCILKYKFSGEARRKIKVPIRFDPAED
jgi:TonB family protein